MKLAVTGPRRGFGSERSVKLSLRKAIQTLQPESLICGMAPGVDILAAEVAIELGVPVTMALPYSSFELSQHFNAAWRNRYYAVYIARATVGFVGSLDSEGSPYFIRNQWMVKECDHLLAYPRHVGGTGHTIRLAIRAEKPITFLDEVLSCVT